MISETCSCGARIDCDYRDRDYEQEVVTRWRRCHRHDEFDGYGPREGDLQGRKK